MPSEPKIRPSFSAANRWGIGFDMGLRTALVLAVAVMANFLGTRFYQRFYLSSQTRVELSSRTLSVLRSITNRVNVTLYYDRRDEFLPDITALLKEYQAANQKISVHLVDYLNDPGEAEKVMVQYRQFFTSPADKNLVIFDYGGRVKIFPGDTLTQYKTSLKGMAPRSDNTKQPELEYERRPVAFNGEQAFTSMLLALSQPPLKAYFMQHHGEGSLADSSAYGYQKFAAVLGQNYINMTNLDWIGDAGVPMDCNLLIIAGPDQPFQQPELQQIEQYLRDGGRLLILFNRLSQGHPTGLEAILQQWGVAVADDIAGDRYHTITGQDIDVDQFGKHPVVNSLSQVRLQLILPRPILKITATSQVANAPEVDELFATSPEATLQINRAEPPHQYPLAVAVEQKPVPGTITPRGNTRIVVVGDSYFLGNHFMDSGGNRDFLNSAVNWLCDRPMLLEGIGPRPVTELRLQITQHQQQQLRWLLLAALPGGVLLLGWLVWLVRRK